MSVLHEWQVVLVSDFLSHDRGPCCPVADTGWIPGLASVHSKSMRGPERGHLCWGENALHWSEKEPIVLYRFSGCVRGCGIVRPFSLPKTKKDFCPKLTSVGRLNIYDSHPDFVYSPPFPLASIRPVIPPFPSLLSSSLPSSPTSPCPPLPQTCTHRISSNLAVCPWVHTVAKAYCSPYFAHCIRALKPPAPPLFCKTI